MDRRGRQQAGASPVAMLPVGYPPVPDSQQTRPVPCAPPISHQQLHCKRWLCCARNKLWWMTPEWGRSARDLPPETQVSVGGVIPQLLAGVARVALPAWLRSRLAVSVPRLGPPLLPRALCPTPLQFLLAELEDGSYATILPLISQDTFRGTLRPPR